MLPEKEDGGVGGQAVIEQIQMGEDFFALRLDGEREVAGLAGATNEAGDGFGVEVVEGGLAGGAGVPRGAVDVACGFKVVHEAGVNGGLQLGKVVEAAADQLTANLPDERLHLRVLVFVDRPLDEDQAGFAEAAGLPVFEMGGREALVVFPAVFLAEDAEVEVALADLVEIDSVGAPVGSRDIALEEKGLEEAAQQGVSGKIVAESVAFPGEFSLDAADENLHVSLEKTTSHVTRSKPAPWDVGVSAVVGNSALRLVNRVVAARL